MDFAEPLLHAEIIISSSMTLSLIFSAPALHNENILLSNRGLNTDRSFSIAELLELGFGGGGAQSFADGFHKEWMRRA